MQARPFLLAMVGLALSGAALVLTVPWLLRSDSAVPLWVPAVLAVLVVGFGVAARSARPDREPRRRS